MNTVSYQEEKRITREKVALPMLWVGMVSMFMIFAALTSAYLVRKMKGGWLEFDLPQLFYISTAIILLSSVTMNQTLQSARKNDTKAIQRFAFFTFVLGSAFIVCQFLGWRNLVDQKVFFAGKDSNAAGSFLYALTGLHLLHLVGGLIAVFVVWINATRKKYDSHNLLGIKLCALFWHFLDGLWIFLFLFLLLKR